MDSNDNGMARVLDAARTLCIHQGNATAAEVATATALDLVAVTDMMAQLARGGDLVARPGCIYSRGLVREVRLPGSSWKFGLVAALTPKKLMVARG